MHIRSIGHRVYECQCGTMGNDTYCPECSRQTTPVWEVQTEDQCVIGYITASELMEAVNKMEEVYQTDNLKLKICYNMPEVLV